MGILKFDENALESLLELSRLTMPREQYSMLSKQLGDILHYFERLSRYDTSKIDVDIGSTVPVREKRPDVSQSGLDHDEIRAFSQTLDENGFFDVPRILGDDRGA